MGTVKGGKDKLDRQSMLLFHAAEFDAWLEENNAKARAPKKKAWNNGEKLEHMGGFSEFINW